MKITNYASKVLKIEDNFGIKEVVFKIYEYKKLSNFSDIMKNFF